MDSNSMLIEAFATSKATEAMIKALKETVLITDELKQTYNENLKKQLTLFAQQYPELSKAFEKAILAVSM